MVERRKKKREKRLKKKREWERKIEARDRAGWEFREAYWHFQRGDHPAALSMARVAARRDPDNEHIHRMIAHIGAGTGDWPVALEAALALHRLHPDDPGIWGMVLDGSLNLGRIDEALRFYEEKVLPHSPAKRRTLPTSLTRMLNALRKERRRASSIPKDSGSRAQASGRRRARPGSDAAFGPLFGAAPKAPESGPAPPVPAEVAPAPPPPPPAIEFSIHFEPGPALDALKARRNDGEEAFELRIARERLLLLGGYDELLCLPELSGVDRYAYQIGTVRRVLQQFRGRVLLADEVGLGKTVEAGMILKEYVLRDLVRTALILVPAPLVGQWAEELSGKFGLEFDTTDDRAYRSDAESFWGRDRVIASIHAARRSPNFERITGREYDIVIVDEAHALKNRTTANWKLVNALRKRFLLLLTATPVQNDLDELYNLVTLLRPGTFKTPSMFRREFIDRRDPRNPRNKGRLREILRTVMVRNTRAAVDVKLPPRYAATHIVAEAGEFCALYENLSAFLHARLKAGGNRMALRTLLMEAGSSPDAVRAALSRMHEKEPDSREIASLLSGYRALGPSAKSAKLVEILRTGDAAKTVVFTQFRPTLQHLARVLEGEGIPFAVFSGAMSNPDKDAAVERFREEAHVLLAGESGGQGRNLQFANALVNFDLPWNPMRIEQRVGRIHRIGQAREVFIFNLCAAGTVEEDLLRVLDEKIHMFELVVGEVDMILGNLDDGKDFAEIVMDLWARAPDREERRASFDRLGEDLIEAKRSYLQTREIDEALFAEEYEA